MPANHRAIVRNRKEWRSKVAKSTSGAAPSIVFPGAKCISECTPQPPVHAIPDIIPPSCHSRAYVEIHNQFCNRDVSGRTNGKSSDSRFRSFLIRRDANVYFIVASFSRRAPDVPRITFIFVAANVMFAVNSHGRRINTLYN